MTADQMVMCVSSAIVFGIGNVFVDQIILEDEGSMLPFFFTGALAGGLGQSVLNLVLLPGHLVSVAVPPLTIIPIVLAQVAARYLIRGYSRIQKRSATKEWGESLLN